MAGATSLLFVYSLDYARTRLANDAKSATKGGSRQFNGLIDVYRKTLASDGIAGLYRGFGPSVLGIVVYRGLYFGMYDSLKPTLLVGPLEGNFLASFMLGWGVTTWCWYCFLSSRHYPSSHDDDVWRGTYHTCPLRSLSLIPSQAVKYNGSMDAARKIFAAEGIRSFFKGAAVPISSVVSQVLVCSPSTIKSSCSSSERPSRAAPAKHLFTLRTRTTYWCARSWDCSWQSFRCLRKS